MHLDEKLNFNHHINEKIAQANKGIGLILILAHVLPKQSLITTYKSFTRPHLDYGDIIYDQPSNERFCNLIVRVRYNAALTMTGAITSQHNPLRTNFTKCSNTLKQFVGKLPTNLLRVFDHFVGFVLKGLRFIMNLVLIESLKFRR